jgi:preprotein translocase subunit SecF
VSPVERRNDRLRNVEIPNRLLHDPDGTDDPDETEDDLDDTVEAGGDGSGDDGADDGATTDQGYEDDEPDHAPAAGGGGGRGGRGRFSLKVLLRLYRGQTKFDFVGRRRWWFLLSGLIIVSGLVSFSIRGFDFGIDFKGGSSWEVTATGVSQATVVKAVDAAGLGPTATVEILGGKTIEVQADLNSLPTAKQNTISNNVSNALERFAPGQSVSKSTVGPTWGGQVTDHALIALVAFFIIVGIYISLRFEPKMALAAFAALVHDLLVAAGVYSLVGFQVTPDTVVAILTILGYSLYDTVVVFDRVRDNARGLGATGRMTYSEMVNLSMNQTLARSINTSLVAILPVLAVLLIGAELLGAVTLQNYGLALFVGLLSGAYSSIFIASPILAIMKEREPRYTVIRQRLSARADRTGVLTPAAAALLVGAAGAGSRQGAGARAGRPGPLRPGALRPGAARAGRAPAGSGNGAREPGVAAASVGGTGPSAAQARSTPARRPPPRPRKGAKRGGKKRR